MTYPSDQKEHWHDIADDDYDGGPVPPPALVLSVWLLMLAVLAGAVWWLV